MGFPLCALCAARNYIFIFGYAPLTGFLLIYMMARSPGMSPFRPAAVSQLSQSVDAAASVIPSLLYSLIGPQALCALSVAYIVERPSSPTPLRRAAIRMHESSLSSTTSSMLSPGRFLRPISRPRKILKLVCLRWRPLPRPPVRRV
jgi:hypothetical protein